MKDKFEQLLHMIVNLQASDVHFYIQLSHVKVTMRGIHGLQEVSSMAFDISLYNYLRYISNLDLGNAMEPQSGNFAYDYRQEHYFFRFSTITSLDKQTAVLRILNNHPLLHLEDLSYEESVFEAFMSWTKIRSGLVVLSGPTGSGKSTTLHAILHQIAIEKKFRVVSLEDPIEIVDDQYVQLQINERNHFSYEEGIKELMRHDPDVIMIGEIRDPMSAKMLMRSALSGHMIFTTIHAGTCEETLHRLMEFGLSKDDLRHTLTAVCTQRLYNDIKQKGKVCVYEILEQDELHQCIMQGEVTKQHLQLHDIIYDFVQKGRVSADEAEKDLLSLRSRFTLP